MTRILNRRDVHILIAVLCSMLLFGGFLLRQFGTGAAARQYGAMGVFFAAAVVAVCAAVLIRGGRIVFFAMALLAGALGYWRLSWLRDPRLDAESNNAYAFYVYLVLLILVPLSLWLTARRRGGG